MEKAQKLQIKLTLDQDALLLLDEAVTPRKRGGFVSALIRDALSKEMTPGDLIAALQRFEKSIGRVDEASEA